MPTVYSTRHSDNLAGHQTVTFDSRGEIRKQCADLRSRELALGAGTDYKRGRRVNAPLSFNLYCVERPSSMRVTTVQVMPL